eukprot:Gregarina_sp_Poly_1__282@NODE_106_length_14132_cov_144_167721_g93_i0_p3_GENE_NODE_106_length_14132_cov_144_167721_g93_i0NODE_106_length_14132_cov_144_167721_g93_i0_p3_ORF_typecomplete_len572_score102_81tRNAsynt_2/PF00152_20/3_2e02tRNAsynt_2/PF00152_20/2_6e99tRNA_anticodon/PF01336_25/2_9e09tRNAsynt_2d/PF01409_20/5_4tRNAsynt_2d/PF01409_20/0_092tRNA_anti_2/PF13742_6/0_14Mt_ATPsynt_D/PF05873_12/0_87Mt_ATPsynt_D/PF05873_12/5_4e02RRP14/PF15459_6/7_2_NODE_106_length_14132_cov_144_167721_g93_i072628977
MTVAETKNVEEPMGADVEKETRRVDDAEATEEATSPGDTVNTEDKKSMKSAKKAAAKSEKEAKRLAREAEVAEQARATAALLATEVHDLEKDNFGYFPIIRSTFRTQRVWTDVRSLTKEAVGKMVWIRGRIQDIRNKGGIGFLVLRQQAWTIQGVMDPKTTSSKDAVKWAASLTLETVVDVFGEVVDPGMEITGATQQVEVHISKIFCINKASPNLPFQLKDANRPELKEDTEEEQLIRVGQEVRLDNRVLDLRTLANQAIMRVSSYVCFLFRESLGNKGFIEIHTPKLIGGSSEGGSNVFKLDYFGKPACLAQSPQLYKQMAISSDLDKVFEIGPVFRAENSNTHRHLCEFVGLDLEMAFKEHYFEVLEVLERLFLDIFHGLEKHCKAEIEAVHRQYPARPFKAPDTVPHIDFTEAIQLLKEAKIGVIPDDISSFDFSTEQEKALGRIIFEKYQSDFYYIINYPLGVRPFYTMPNPADERFSNSYDFFMRGEEILSGAQRIHDPALLAKRAAACGIDINTIKDYIDAFSLGAFPHAGAGVGLERVMMLFLGLNNIRKTSMYPRDPKRLFP